MATNERSTCPMTNRAVRQSTPSQAREKACCCRRVRARFSLLRDCRTDGRVTDFCRSARAVRGNKCLRFMKRTVESRMASAVKRWRSPFSRKSMHRRLVFQFDPDQTWRRGQPRRLPAPCVAGGSLIEINGRTWNIDALRGSERWSSQTSSRRHRSAKCTRICLQRPRLCQ